MGSGSNVLAKVFAAVMLAVIAIVCWGATWAPSGQTMTPVAVVAAVIAVGCVISAGWEAYWG